MEFWGYDHVVASKSSGVINRFFIQFCFDCAIRFLSCFICGNKRDILCTVPIFGSFSLACFQGFCLFHLFIDFIFLLFRKFWVESYNPLFCKFQGSFVTGAVRVGIGKIIHAFFYTIQEFSLLVFYIFIVVFKQNPCFFCFRERFYGFRENISVTGFQGMKDISAAV